MSRNSFGAESEEETFTVGTPSLSEIREYFSTNQYYTAESGTDSNSSGELSESFAELLEKRKEELKVEQSGSKMSGKYPTRRIYQTPDTVKNLTFDDPVSSQEEGRSMWNTEDDSFLAAEKVCEKTLEYNRYMMNMQMKEDEEDQTILNDVEPPSMLCEQTLLRLTPGKPFSRPSTIFEESTMATSECSFYTADLAKTIQSDSVDTLEDTLSEKVEVIDLSDESSGTTEGREQSEQSSNSTIPTSQDDSSFNMSREFNDSLERVEYLMKHAEKFQKKQGLMPHQTPPSSSSSGTIPKSNEFKQPRVPPTKIPQMRKGKFDHIKSPIAAYINKSPLIPTFAANRLANDLVVVTNKSPRKVAVGGEKENREIVLSPKPSKVTIPKKAYISAAYANVHDERVNPVAGGPKMMKLIGDQMDPEKTPGITRHVYRYKTTRLPPDVVAKERAKMSLGEESIADLSVMSGDVSVQVVTNAIKY